MGVMKRLNQWHRVEGGHINQSLRVLAGLEEPPETKEERAIRKEAEAEAKAERAAIQSVEAEVEARRLAEWRDDVGAPVAPQASTGFYSCESLPGAYFPVGTGPWPDYRTPGLAWERSWKQPKPDDVPWADELPPPKAWAPDPKPISASVGKLKQASLF